MQAEIRWTPPSGALGRLTRQAHARAAVLAPELPDLRARGADAPAPPPFAAALRAGSDVALIAEIKRRSPSKGEINPTLDAVGRARTYEREGAKALSVLTEPTEFGGRSEDLADVRGAVALPLIRKDFNVHPAQIWEGRVLGASAILLIARALPPGELERLVDVCHEAGVEPLVEIRSDEELSRAAATTAEVIGVNARDLETLVIDPEVTSRLLPSIPAGRVRVAESGLTAVADVERVAALGADAILVGSSLSAAGDPESVVRAFATVRRRDGR